MGIDHYPIQEEKPRPVCTERGFFIPNHLDPVAVLDNLPPDIQ